MMKHRKKQWKMMKTREKTMNHDEKEKKNNEKWWKRENKQWSMMKKREKTMKNDETEREEQWTMMKNRETTMKIKGPDNPTCYQLL